MKKDTHSRKLWLLIEAHGIGGSETRIIKLASEISNHDLFDEIILVVPPKLRRLYFDQKSLKHLLTNSKFKFHSPRSIKIFFWSAVHALIRPFGINTSSMESLFLKKKSWFNYLNNRVNENDIIHCYRGVKARNGAFLFSKKRNNSVIIEITSNRSLDQISEHFKLLNVENSLHENLIIKSVSKNVYNNWNLKFKSDWFLDRNIDNDYYRGPFIKFKNKVDTLVKENIIVFPHRFVGPKNGILFSKVINELLEEKKLKGWKILFRGKGPEESTIRNNLEEWIGKKRVEIDYSENLFNDLKKSKIVVSLIETGSYPSQSIFESLQAGCTQLISDSGNSREEFNHPAIQFTTLNIQDIKNDLLKLANMEEEFFKVNAKLMQNYYKWLVENRNQLNEVINIYEDQ